MLLVLRFRLIACLTAAGLLYGISLPLLAQGVPADIKTTKSSRATPASVLMRDPMASYEIEQNIFTPVKAAHGMVATESALATRIGIDILRQGGNAIDAAVAIGFAMAVTLPSAGNLGGGGFMLIHDRQSGRNIALDFRETAPAAARRDMYLDSNGNLLQGKSLYTHLAVDVPGTPAGLLKALKQYGTLSRETVLAPAIKLAREGFPLPDVLAKSLHAEADHLQRWPATRKIFFKPRSHFQSQPCADDTSHVPLEAGDILVQLDLANTLERIARDGVRGFYEGETAEKIAAEMKAHQGIVSLKDLSAYRVVERQPVVGTYRGYRVVSMPPPSSGGAHVVQILNILERYPLGHYGAGSAQAIHLMTEAMKLAFADRSQYMGDPDFVKIALRGLTSRAYADQLAASIHGSRAIAGNDLGPGKPQAYESSQTTHYSVLDQAGNAVSTTYTLNLNFGSGIVAEGRGVLLNNEMDDFAIKAGEANAVQASKRPLSSMTPVIVLKDDKPWLVTGSPGGARIISTVLQTLVNAIDHGMNPAESAAQPRFHHQGVPDELRIERGFSPDTLNRLKSMGHNIAVKPPMGRTQTIQWHDGMLYGASDPRNPDGLTAGY